MSFEIDSMWHFRKRVEPKLTYTRVIRMQHNKCNTRYKINTTKAVQIRSLPNFRISKMYKLDRLLVRMLKFTNRQRHYKNQATVQHQRDSAYQNELAKKNAQTQKHILKQNVATHSQILKHNAATQMQIA
ncbi:hypothetical protein N7532_005182 [Penicillium argentinense]|uniref:Uncharacterized protein n=1 Tax=Penicillium argentinense TaxID=1131581 RepID=A0A9W9FDF5_9EURO|nr:uncharacterized protein N7532_005182 [Penicillium argentinense]KAJ5098181.1 hypothetical protein N7532_005182 [Penicillium argentinense]